MREFERIDRITNLINKVWKKYPELRLGQLITNAVRGLDIFYIEDEILEEKLKAFDEKGYNV